MPTRGHENAGYRRLFDRDGLTFGAGFPLTGANRSMPDLEAEIELAKHAESVGFDGLWARDVPTYWPKFGDAGQTFDTWPWLSRRGPYRRRHRARHLECRSHTPPSHPRREIRGDRRPAFRWAPRPSASPPATAIPSTRLRRRPRGAARPTVPRVRRGSPDGLARGLPRSRGTMGIARGDLDVVPKPTAETIPLLPTGHARQSREWIAEHGNGWLFYHLPERTLEDYLADWREGRGTEAVRHRGPGRVGRRSDGRPGAPAPRIPGRDRVVSGVFRPTRGDGARSRDRRHSER